MSENFSKQKKIEKHELVLGIMGSTVSLLLGLIILILFMEYNLNSYMYIGPVTVILASFLGIITTIFILGFKPKIGGIILIIIGIWLLINLTLLGTFSAILLFLTSYYVFKRTKNDETLKRNKLKYDSFFFSILGSIIIFTMGIIGLYLTTIQMIEPNSLYWSVNAIISAIIGFIIALFVIIPQPKLGGIVLILIAIWLIFTMPIFGILGGIFLITAGSSELIKNKDIVRYF
ncbi:MAG: hypothetical protein NKF70_02140 [Methanobacterium sp. ERen5]|nr:MAG: hypothetical protein NKF70_02140 [Methanobacterium sp. ERen5]